MITSLFKFKFVEDVKISSKFVKIQNSIQNSVEKLIHV